MWNPAHMQLSGRTPISGYDYIQYHCERRRVNFKSAEKLKPCSGKMKIVILTLHYVQMTTDEKCSQSAKWRQSLMETSIDQANKIMVMVISYKHIMVWKFKVTLEGIIRVKLPNENSYYAHYTYLFWILSVDT